jgi:hypothetical protein
MRLRQRPIRVLTSITVDGDLVDPTLYSVRYIDHPRSAVITFTDTDVWWWGNDNILVTYNHGYDLVENVGALNVPADIRLVALLSARRVFEAVGTSGTEGGGALTGETIGDYSYTLSDVGSAEATTASELTDGEKYILDRYRIELAGDTPTY